MKEIEKEREREKQKELEKEREKALQVRDGGGKDTRDKDRDRDINKTITVEGADKKENRKQRLPSEENTQILYDSRFDNSNKNNERWGTNEQQPSYNSYRKVSRSRSRSKSKGKRSKIIC